MFHGEILGEDLKPVRVNNAWENLRGKHRGSILTTPTSETLMKIAPSSPEFQRGALNYGASLFIQAVLTSLMGFSLFQCHTQEFIAA